MKYTLHEYIICFAVHTSTACRPTLAVAMSHTEPAARDMEHPPVMVWMYLAVLM